MEGEKRGDKVDIQQFTPKAASDSYIGHDCLIVLSTA